MLNLNPTIYLQNPSPEQALLRRTFAKAMKAYGPGIAHLERKIQETLLDVVDALQQKEGQPVNTFELSNGFFCCVLASVVNDLIVKIISTMLNFISPVHQLNNVSKIF